MRLLVLILNKVELLDELLTAFTDCGIQGATILTSTGMARELARADGNNDVPFLGSLRALLDPEREENKTIFTVLREEQVGAAVETIEAVVGDLSDPDTGILFTLPVDYMKGMGR